MKKRTYRIVKEEDGFGVRYRIEIKVRVLLSYEWHLDHNSYSEDEAREWITKRTVETKRTVIFEQ